MLICVTAGSEWVRPTSVVVVAASSCWIHEIRVLTPRILCIRLRKHTRLLVNKGGEKRLRLGSGIVFHSLTDYGFPRFTPPLRCPCRLFGFDRGCYHPYDNGSFAFIPVIVLSEGHRVRPPIHRRPSVSVDVKDSVVLMLMGTHNVPKLKPSPQVQ